MDRRIPPESPPVPSRTENLALKIKQGMHRDAFDSALQRADHRSSMDSRDRVVTAGVKQAHTVPTTDTRGNHIEQACSELGAFSLFKSTPLSEQVDVEQLEPGVEIACAEFVSKAASSELMNHGFAAASAKLLSDESLAMLLKKIQVSPCEIGDSIVLELVDDPSGVMQISLTRGQCNRWTVYLVLTPQEKRDAADEGELAGSLTAQLQRGGILVGSVSVERDG